MPTYLRTVRFRREFKRLSVAEQSSFRQAVREFVADLSSPTRRPRARLRVKQLSGRPGVWEITWAPDGRATFEYGDSPLPGEVHVIWRRCGGHEIFDDP